MILDFFVDNPTASSLLCVATVIFAMFSSIKVNTTFRRYSGVHNSGGVTASRAAREILDANGLYDVQVTAVRGNLTDHYDSRTNTISLSEPVFNSTSVAAIGVAAHEAGHAVQYAKGFFPIKVRNFILPAAQLGSHAWIWLLLLGFVMGVPLFIDVGIILFAFIFLFQLVTLPVELNASRRAMSAIRDGNILDGDEAKKARKVLTAAAMTYVASVLVSLAQHLRLLSRNRR